MLYLTCLHATSFTLLAILSPVERSVWKSMGDDGPAVQNVHFRFPSLSQKRRFLKLSNINLNQPTYKASARTSDKNLTSPFCSRYWIIYYLPEKERKVVNKRSFRSHNCKTDHITSCKGRELLWNVHKWKAYKTTVFHCWICTFLTLLLQSTLIGTFRITFSKSTGNFKPRSAVSGSLFAAVAKIELSIKFGILREKVRGTASCLIIVFLFMF